MPSRWRAFTLIEVFLVIMIVAVLWLIKVPGIHGGHFRFMEASRCHRELRTLAGAIQMQRLDNPYEPVVFGPGCLKPLKTGNHIQENFGAGHPEAFPYFLVPGTGELACHVHGLPGARDWQSPRQHLEARGIRDPALLARMSTDPVSESTRRQRSNDRTQKAFIVFAAVWVVLALLQTWSRWSEAKSAEHQPSMLIGLAIAAGLGTASWVMLGWDDGPEPGDGPRVERSVAPSPRPFAPPPSSAPTTSPPLEPAGRDARSP